MADTENSPKRDKLDSFEKVLAWAVEQGYDESYMRHNYKLEDDFWWAWRESVRFDHRDYVRPSWNEALRAHLVDDKRRLLHGMHMHLSLNDNQRIAYTPNAEYGRADRQIVTTVGRFLTKHFSDVFTEGQIRGWTDIHKQMYGEPIVHFAFDAADIEHAYEDGPHSCMVGKFGENSDWSVPEHPVRIYDGPDTAVATIVNVAGDITARALVRIEEPLSYIRIYGDDALLRHRLNALGFSQQDSAHGMRLRYVPNPHNDEGVLCPYLDGVSYAEPKHIDGKAFLVPGNGDWCCQMTHGYAGWDPEESDHGAYCNYCEEDGLNEENGSTIRNGDWVCSSCIDDSYTWAVAYTNGEYAYVHSDDVVCVGDDYYFDRTSVLEANDIVRLEDDDPSDDTYAKKDYACEPIFEEGWYHQDNCVWVSNLEAWVLERNYVRFEGHEFHRDHPPDEVASDDAGGWVLTTTEETA